MIKIQMNLIEKHAGIITTLANRLKRPGVELDDLIQVGKIAVHKIESKVVPGDGERRLIWMCAERAMSRLIRQSFSTIRIPDHRYGKVFFSFADLYSETGEGGILADKIPETVEPSLASDEIRLVHKSLDRLEEPYRQHVIDYYFEGKSTAEIGQANKCSRQMVELRLKMALSSLTKNKTLKEVYENVTRN